MYDETKKRRKALSAGRARAKAMRYDPVSAEELFWSLVRNRRLRGHKFRRQVPIGPFVVDFLCAESHLIVELDGPSHGARRNYDAERDVFLKAQGYDVMRFDNEEFARDTALVLATIAFALDAPSPRPSPPLKRGRGS